MKKLLGLGILLMAGTLYADPGNKQFYQSSYTASTDLYKPVGLSTCGTTKLIEVKVGSGAANGYIAFYDASVFTAATSTKAYLSTNNIGSYGPFEIAFSSGLMYTKDGASKVTMIWDWVVRGACR